MRVIAPRIMSPFSSSCLAVLALGAAPLLAQRAPTIYVATEVLLNTGYVQPHSARVLRLRDANADGDYGDPGEQRYMVDYSAGPGTSPYAGSVSVALREDGTLLISDWAGAVVYRARDLNDDGDFDDPFEMLAFFDYSIAAPLVWNPLDHAIDAQDGLWFATKGHPTFGGFDGVSRCVDLNGDGDANDAGEVEYRWWNQTPAFFATDPVKVLIGRNGEIYFDNQCLEFLGEPGVYRLTDLNGDNDFNDLDEVGLFFPTSAFLSSLPLVVQNTGDGTWWVRYYDNGSKLAAGFDANGDGLIEPSEVHAVQVGNDGVERVGLEAGFDGELFVSERVAGHFRLARYLDSNGDGAITTPAEQRIVWNDPAAQYVRDFVVEGGGGRPSPESYCVSGTSAAGCTLSLHAAGRPSTTDPAGFTLTLRGADGQRPASVFYGLAPTNLPWGASSTLCVASPIQRTPLALTSAAANCSATHTLDWNAFRATWGSPLGAPFSVGQQFYAQAWTRDGGANPKGVLSNAIHFWLLP